MRKLEIPPFLSHLTIDDRGYPIPFFVAIVNGKPDFRLLDAKKQHKCYYQNLCGICGKKLEAFVYTISGPIGLKNSVSRDPLMHKECALFSLYSCPHLHFEKADRRDTDELYKEIERKEAGGVLVKEKPNRLYLVMAIEYQIYDYGGGNLIYKIVPKTWEEYHYENGILVKK